VFSATLNVFITLICFHSEEAVLTPQQLQSLAEYLPTVEEANALKQYAAAHGKDRIADMCECEKFMIAMLNVRQAENKIRCLLFKQQFPAHH
jgi:hypothetical protein